MKIIFLIISVLLIVTMPGYCDTPAVEVKVTAATQEIFIGQAIIATVQVANTGTVDLRIPRPDRVGFGNLLFIDNPQLEFSRGVGIIGATDEDPAVIIRPGESVSKQISLSGTTRNLLPITFRVGFKARVDSVPVWSNPVTVGFRNDKDFPVKVEALLKEDNINISNVRNPKYAIAHVRITNVGSSSQSIGFNNVCGLHELINLVSDNQYIEIISGVMSCDSNAYRSGEAILKPGETYEQDCRVSYQGEEPNPEPISFRIGVKNVGSVPAWSNVLTVNIVGGSDQWKEHMVYFKGYLRDMAATTKEGVVKVYYENGALMEERAYKEEKLNGPCKRYYENGQLRHDLNFADGILNGWDKEYDEEGRLVRDEFYSNGQPVSSITYNKNGSIREHLRLMKFEGGNYFYQEPCAETDSDPEVLKNMPKCDTLGNKESE